VSSTKAQIKLIKYTLAHIVVMCQKPFMDKKTLMHSLCEKAFDMRVTLPDVCFQAGVSPTIAYRYMNGTGMPTLKTIAKLEKALAELEESGK
jgi:DNA-binding phage protein